MMISFGDNVHVPITADMVQAARKLYLGGDHYNEMSTILDLCSAGF